ncbi:MAG: hypothetical protein QW510_00040 [Candidatus Bathyarchaeia archaeon]
MPMEKDRFSLRVLLVAFVLMVVGVLLLLHGSNMLFEMNPLAIFVMDLAAILIFSGIILMVMAATGLVSV